MTFRLPYPSFPRRARLSAALRSGILGRCLLLPAALALLGAKTASAQDPAITRQPTDLIVMASEDWGFSVEVSGTPPFSYQWFVNGAPFLGQTNSTLSFTNAQNANIATYSVQVTNSVGSVMSESVTLTISSTPPRSIRNGTVSGTTVPILFAASGRESSVSFSMKFDTNVLVNPAWIDLVPGAVSTIDTSQSANGIVGLSVSVPVQFPQTNQVLGLFDFGAGVINDPYQAGIVFTNSPTVIEAISTNMASMALSAFAAPDFSVLDATPVFNPQSGLMEQRILVRYAGGVTLPNVEVAVDGLGVDSLTNRIELFNATGTSNIDTNGYGGIIALPIANAGSFSVGTQKTNTLEYYVTDRTTLPTPVYYLNLAGNGTIVVPQAASPLSVTRQEFVNGEFIIQFPTELGFNYYIQYAANTEDLKNNGPTSRVANPPVAGTGYEVQWIDNGPPKTESPPTDSMRVYRVLELPAN